MNSNYLHQNLLEVKVFIMQKGIYYNYIASELECSGGMKQQKFEVFITKALLPA